MTITATVSVEIDAYDFLVTRGDLHQFILDLDASQADVNFTKKLIEDLCQSLKNDFSPKEFSAFIGGLKS